MSVRAETLGIWVTPEELADLPMSGPAWERLEKEANKQITDIDLFATNRPENTRAMAKALVYVRTGKNRYRKEVLQALQSLVAAELDESERTLGLGINLAAYVIAADLIDLSSYAPLFDTEMFRPWLDLIRHKVFSGRTLVTTHDDRPNNWGTNAGPSRIAVALYLNDQEELERAAQVFKGFLGDRRAHSERSKPGFKYGSLDWQACSTHPVGINPVHSSRSGHSIDGVLPDDQRRAGGFTWPPQKEPYVYIALEGVIMQAEMLSRAGYDAWFWSDKAILRAYTWLYEEAKYPASGNKEWHMWLVNARYGSTFPTKTQARHGKMCGWTDWTLMAKP